VTSRDLDVSDGARDEVKVLAPPVKRDEEVSNDGR
jgi:hypothetical protein